MKTNKVKELRIALVLHGQARFALDCIPRQIERIPGAEVFFHTWEDKSEKTVANWINAKDIEFNSTNELINNINPVSYETSDYPEVNCNAFKNIDIVTTIYRKMYSFYRADQLRQTFEKQNNFLYDYVICSRFDYYPIGKMLIKTKLNEVALPDLRKFPYKNCDLFLVGKSETISRVTDLYNDINELYKFKEFTSGEELLSIYAIKKNIVLFDFKTSGFLMRDKKLTVLKWGKINFTDGPLLWLKFQLKYKLVHLKIFGKIMH